MWLIMHQSIIDRVLLFKKIKIKQKMIKYNIYSTKFDIPKNLILKHDQRMLFYIFTFIFTRETSKSNAKLTHFLYSLL